MQAASVASCKGEALAYICKLASVARETNPIYPVRAKRASWAVLSSTPSSNLIPATPPGLVAESRAEDDELELLFPRAAIQNRLPSATAREPPVARSTSPGDKRERARVGASPLEPSRADAIERRVRGSRASCGTRKTILNGELEGIEARVVVRRSGLGHTGVIAPAVGLS